MQTSLRISVIILLLAWTPAQAQTPATAADDFFDDGPLILTASRMAKPLLESPASVSVIDRRMIAASGARELAELFRLVPGFVVGFQNGHSPAVSYHGLGQEFGRQLQVLIDGRSVFIPSFGGVPWSNLPLLIEDIERIEVIRGPNAVTYGANAFLATINIITRHAAEDYGVQYSATASDDSNPDIKDAYLRVGNQHQDIDWRLSLGVINDDGYASINDSKRSAKINFRMDLLGSSNQLWTFQLGSSNSEAGRGFPSSPETITNIERDEEATNGYLNLQWEEVRDSSTSIARLTHTRQQVTDNYDPGPFTLEIDAGPSIAGVTTFIDFDRVSERTDLEFVQTDDLNNSLRLVYGGSARRDRVKSLYLLNDENFHVVDTSRLFGGFEWRIDDDWLLDLGVMLEDSSLTTTESSPRISLIRKFGKRHALRLVASAAKRNPILWESEGETEFNVNLPAPISTTIVIPTWIGNNEIEPEQIESYEAGLRSQLASGIEADIKLFRYEISNHIVPSSVPVALPPPINAVIDVESDKNGESTRVRGLEVAFGYPVDDWFGVNAGFSVVDAQSSLADFEDSIPDHTAFVAAQYRPSARHEFSGAFYYLDEIKWIDTSTVIPVARRLDLRYAYHLRNSFNFEIIGQNLLEDYADYQSENVHDQVIYLRFSGGF